MFLTLTPGSACEIERPFRNSSSLTQPRSVTNSRSNQPLSPPPKLVSEMRVKIRNRRSVVGEAGSAGVIRNAFVAHGADIKGEVSILGLG